jgi:hypothetical protein
LPGDVALKPPRRVLLANAGKARLRVGDVVGRVVGVVLVLDLLLFLCSQDR